MDIKKIASAIALIVLASLSGTAVYADNKSIIKHRQAVMAAIGGHTNALFLIAKGLDQFAGDRVMHAENLAALAKVSADTFPEGSSGGKTRSKPNIWTDKDEFKRMMDDFIVKADALSVAAKGQDSKAYGVALKALGGSCKSCHDDFKKD